MAFFGITALGPPNQFKSALINAVGINIFPDEEFKASFAASTKITAGTSQRRRWSNCCSTCTGSLPWSRRWRCSWRNSTRTAMAAFLGRSSREHSYASATESMPKPQAPRSTRAGTRCAMTVTSTDAWMVRSRTNTSSQ